MSAVRIAHSLSPNFSGSYMKLALAISILVFSMASTKAWATESKAREIGYYLYESTLKVAFGKSEPIHGPHFDLQERIFAQALKKGVSGPRPPSVRVISDFGYRVESQEVLIADILMHPLMEDERNKIVSQFNLLERIAQIQGTPIEDLGLEQVLQLIDSFMALEPDKEFQFKDFSNAEELKGRVTKRNSLLRYHSYFVQYLFGRRLMTFERTEGENWNYLLPGIMSFQPIIESPKVAIELRRWLNELRSAPSEYDLITDPAFERKLSVEARALLNLAMDAFLEVNQRESAKVIQRFQESQSIAKTYDGMRAAAANAYHQIEIAKETDRPLSLDKPGKLGPFRYCKELLGRLKRRLK